MAYMGISDWTVSWGPKVCKVKPEEEGGPDNIWLAATKTLAFPDGKGYKTCVVALAGTRLFSIYDWEEDSEDFAIQNVVDFKQWTNTWVQGVAPPEIVQPGNVQPGGIYISERTAAGTYVLVTQTAPPETQAPGTTLPQYLASLEGVEKLILTGHSLAGALCPPLAAELIKTGLINNFNPQKGAVLVAPPAGASPGNTDFAAFYNQTLPPSPTSDSGYKIWNTDLFNKYDIVPQAWCFDPNLSPARNLENIPGIYGDDPSGLIYDLINVAVQREIVEAKSSGAVYMPIQGNEFDLGAPPVPQTLLAYFGQVSTQHSAEYSKYYGVTPPPLAVPSEGVRRKTLTERAKDFHVFSYLVAEIAAAGGDEIETPA